VSGSWAPLPPFDLRPRPQVFLGWDCQESYQRCWSTPEDSVGIVGPPRYGKTSGLIIPALLYWQGPLVSTSTRGDVLSFTGDHRARLAGTGGRVHVYDPFGSEYPGRSLRWTPLAGCTDPSVCYRRVAAMTAVAASGTENGDHWRAGAASLLRGYLHAAALDGVPLRTVRRWLARQETRDAVAILRLSASPAAMWADDLDAVHLLGDRERGSFFSVARTTLEATADPTVLDSCAGDDLDLDDFLDSCSSLFIIGPSHQQQAIAPLTAGLIDSIAQRAAELAAARGGRLDPPLLLALDEVANIAPLQSLPALVSEGGGRGVVTMWAAQSLSQLRVRYGPEAAAAILTATSAKIIFGGMSHGEDLRNISAWAGQVRQSTTSTSFGPAAATGSNRVGIAAGASGQSYQVGSEQRDALPVEALQQLAPLHAWLFWRSEPPRMVQARPAGAVPDFARLKGFTVP